MTIDLKEAMKQLESLGDERVRAQNSRQGCGDNQFGVRLGEIRKVAKKIKTDHELGKALWKTDNVDAQFLSTLVMKPNSLSVDEMNQMVGSINFSRVADWMNSYVVKKHPDKEAFRESWMQESNSWLARAGWSLTSERVAKNPDGLDMSALLDRIENEMADAVPEVQWTMNMVLVDIGINSREHRERALAIGEKLGIYRDYPVPKGCTSPFAPIWINEMVSRQQG